MVLLVFQKRDKINVEHIKHCKLIRKTCRYQRGKRRRNSKDRQYNERKKTGKR